MKAAMAVRRAAQVAAMVAVWCALWGEVSVANVVGGTLVAVAVLAAGFGSSGRGGVHPWPLIRFAGSVGVDIVRSTAGVAWEVLTPTDRTREAIVAVPVPLETRSHLLLMTVAITVTPGSAVVDADPATGTLYLHVLHENRRDEIVTHVQHLAALACAGLVLDRPDPQAAGDEAAS